MPPGRRPAADEESNGFQWHIVGPGVGCYFLSAAFAYLAGDPSLGSSERLHAAFGSATLMLVLTMLAMGVLSRFIHHSRLGSPLLFGLVWLAVAMCVLAAGHR
jgi:hypothetical protein